MAAKGKQPKAWIQPNPTKQPRRFEAPEIEGEPMAWRFSRADRGGAWRWSAATGEHVHELLNRLGDFESQNLAQLRNGGSHPVPVADLCKEAQDRLAAIEQDDLDDLMSFRVTGRRRVWCIRDRNIMHVLWWDPDHQVCPSLKRHT